jgi:hypothetical protein
MSGTAPDLSTDDAAFRAAQEAVRQAERERHRRYEKARADAAEAREAALRADLARRFPSTVPDQVFDLAGRASFHDEYDNVSDQEMAETYEEIVALIDEAIRDSQAMGESG